MDGAPRPTETRSFSCLETVRLEITDADGDNLEVGRAERGSDVRGLGKLVVDRALGNELPIRALSTAVGGACIS